MKVSIIALIAAFCFLIPTSPSFAEMSVKNANSAALSASYTNDRDNDNLNASQEQRENNRDNLAQALSDQRAAIEANQEQKSELAAKKGSSLSAPVVNGIAYRLGITQRQQVQVGTLTSNGTINVSVTSLTPTTPVKVTVNGITTVTTAGEIAKFDPTVQVEVPHLDALIITPRGNSNTGETAGGVHGGSGRGGDNAHSHAMGGHGFGADNSHSEGFGGHSHFH